MPKSQRYRDQTDAVTDTGAELAELRDAVASLRRLEARHQFRNRVAISAFILLYILAAAGVWNSVLNQRNNARTDARLSALEANYNARVQQRSQQLRDMDERFRQGMCDLLDSLPAGAFFDPLRQKYECTGTGVPLSSLTPEQQQNLSDITSKPLGVVPYVPTPDEDAPSLGGSGPLPGENVAPRPPVIAAPTTAAPSSAAPQPAPAASSTAAATTAPPLINSVTDPLLCKQLHLVCLGTP